MKFEIEISERLDKHIAIAAKNLKMSKKKFILRAIRKSALANQEKQMTEGEITASLNAFFQEYPELNVGWWADRSWDEYQSRRQGGAER